EEWPGYQRVSHFFQQQYEFHFAQTQPAKFFWENDAGEALLRHFPPQGEVIGRVSLHQPSNFPNGALDREKLPRIIFENFLAFTQSKLHKSSSWLLATSC